MDGDTGSEAHLAEAVRARSRAWIGALALIAAPFSLAGPLSPHPDGFRVLFIGNSLTYGNDLPGMLQRLLTLGGIDSVVVEAEARPDFALPDHWDLGVARRRIRTGRWSVVILQQGPSATEGRPYLLEYARRFADEIRAAHAQPALYMVWPARSREFDFDGVLDSYRTAARRADALFLPAGQAWRIAWERRADLGLYGPDGFHPSVLGSYLAALVMYQQLAQRDPRELPPLIPTADGDLPLDPDQARLLQEAAMEANARYAMRLPRQRR